MEESWLESRKWEGVPGSMRFDAITIGDRVEFYAASGVATGIIVNCDQAGGGWCYRRCPSYDIKGDDGILVKHVPASDVSPIRGGR